VPDRQSKTIHSVDLKALRPTSNNEEAILCFFLLSGVCKNAVVGDDNVKREKTVIKTSTLLETIMQTVGKCTTHHDVRQQITVSWTDNDDNGENVTNTHSKCVLRHSYRYGRVTASIAMQCAWTVKLPDRQITGKDTSAVKTVLQMYKHDLTLAKR